MQIIYEIFDELVSLTTNEKASYLPLGKSYFVFSQNKSSKYFGLNYYDKKILDFNFSFPEIKKIKIKENALVINDNIMLNFHNNIIKISSPIKIYLDPRHLYDYNPFNRKINITHETSDCLSLSTNEYNLKFEGIFEKKVKKWVPFKYSLDKRRGEKEEWWLYYLGDFKGEIKVPFNFNDKKKEYFSKREIINSYFSKGKTNNYLRLAFKISCRNLLDKQVGRPWFFQEWKRDYLISFNAFYYLNEITFIKHKVFYYISLLKEYIKNHKLFHIDEIGLLLKKTKDFWFLFDENEKEYIINNLLDLHYTAPIYNEKGESWMDSIDREGISIEIQALFYEGFELLKEYDNEFKYLQQKIEKVVNEMLFHDYILDGLERYEIRPNYILAYYFSPKLAEKIGFDKYFFNNLEQLWLEWGGISSLSKYCPLFYKKHTGINSKSYHNGDSWYFINNITGTILLKFLEKYNNKNKKNNKKEKIEEKIFKLLNSSIRDILLLYIPSGHSEISSSFEQESLGCFDQLWSNATFIEFVIHYLKQYNNLKNIKDFVSF